MSMGGGDDTTLAKNSGADSGAGVNINIRCSSGSKFSLQVNLDSTVGSFKSKLVEHANVPVEQQRLIYKGRILKDDQTLQSYGLEADHTVHLVRGFAPAPSANPASATNAGGPTTAQNAPRDATPDAGAPFPGSGLGASTFPGLGSGGGSLFGAGLPDFEQVQQQLTQNPDLMRDMMNMPLFQNFMNNPETIRNLILNNPQMREIMDRNPELAHVLNDPATLRQTMEAARNPELMREMMRNTDRAMSNIESSPEGFNMLRRMYENVQEPFLNASTLSGDARNDTGSNPFAALLGAQGGGQGRQQPNNPPTTGSETPDNLPAPNTNPLPNPWASAGTGAAQTNTTARSNTAGGTRDAPLGLGGLASPGLEQMLGGMPDTTSLNQMMQNPAVSQMMQSLLSNPQYMNQVLGLNPQLRSMLDSNPQLREMMQNPEFIRQLTSPETMQQLMTFQQGLASQLGRQQTNQQGQNAGGGALDNAGMEMLMNMFGGLGTGGLGVPNRPNVPPEELYATQLTQLQEMGFFDTQENIRALTATAGNVHAAVERLLGNLPIPDYQTPPPNPNSNTKFPSQLMPSFHATCHLRHPVTSLLRELSRNYKRVIVIYDSLIAWVLEDTPSIQNVECYSLRCISTVSIRLWRDDSITPEFAEYVKIQKEFREKINRGDLFNSCYEVEGLYLDSLAKEKNAGVKQWAIGPLNPMKLFDRRDQIKPHECIEWLDDQEPNSVIFVSFGTTTSLSDEEIQELAMGLERSEQKFIWVLREADKGDIFTGESRKVELPDGYEDKVLQRWKFNIYMIILEYAPALG